MILYLICPTCGDFLTENFEEYNLEKKKIENSNKSKNEKDMEKAKLLNKFYPNKNICCRMRIMSYIPFHEVVVF